MPRRAKGRRRLVLFAALCVALGLLTSVGVAWGGMFIPLPATTWSWLTEQGPVILTANNDSISLEYEEAAHRVANRVDFRAISDYKGPYGDDRFVNPSTYAHLTDNVAFRQAVRRHEPLMLSPYRYRVTFSLVYAGWPARCLAYEDACTPAESWGAGGARVLVYNMRTGEMTPSPIEFDPLGNLQPNYHAINLGGTFLPTFPLWPGLLANTAIYGSAWAVLLGTPILIRRWIRLRRSGCAQCGYSREGLKDGRRVRSVEREARVGCL